MKLCVKKDESLLKMMELCIKHQAIDLTIALQDSSLRKCVLACASDDELSYLALIAHLQPNATDEKLTDTTARELLLKKQKSGDQKSGDQSAQDDIDDDDDDDDGEFYIEMKILQ